MAWDPQHGPQTSALLADWVDDLFFGGERGGGKSDYQLGYQEDGALRYGKRWRGIMFRRTYPEIEELQSRALDVFTASGAIYKMQSSAGYPFSNCWYWPSGASVKMRYIEHERDYSRYHGHQYTGVSCDEVTEYATPGPILRMQSTLRSTHGVPCTIRSSGNPGGVGHVWVRQRYVDFSPPFVPRLDPESGLLRMWIPSRLADNTRMHDPEGYRRRIIAATAGNDALRRAWLDGRWDIVVGAFFDCWSDRLRLRMNWIPPAHWTRYGSFDWGSAKPFSYQLWAIANEDIETPDHSGRKVRIPRGALVCYREWYGAKQGEANTGLKLTAEQVADGILQLERHEPKIAYRVADPSIWKEDGGPSHAERMFVYRAPWDRRAPKAALQFRPADNSRVAGWDQLRARMLGEFEGAEGGEPRFGDPLIFWTDNCRDSIRLIPAMQHDEHKVEDIDTASEDHCADSARYACMSRPISLVPKPQPRAPHPHTGRALMGDA
ncbi:MAG: hypothetical protein IT531_00185 [Burkholderiales bacterium]|nr:hypothetical protein [Burkholderiales bacterium]